MRTEENTTQLGNLRVLAVGRFGYSQNGNCPKGVTAAAGSHSTWTRPPKVSTATGFWAFRASRFA